MSYDISAVQGKFFDKVFALPIRVYYEDTDAGGIVYYANYLKFAERARTEYIRALGCTQSEALEEDKCGFTVRHVEIDYKKPAKLDDELIVTCVLGEIKGATAIMHQEVLRGDDLLAVIDVKVAYVNLARLRPVRIPEWLVKIC
ncbi:MAG: tol-pal system-associated acyl-CoA thioesterase [Alphaproteobacteria bacterium]|nr:tol-pal system-associated acyl-CoA thioesterase [Alphaproteobacteria bacterium]